MRVSFPMGLCLLVQLLCFFPEINTFTIFKEVDLIILTNRSLNTVSLTIILNKSYSHLIHWPIFCFNLVEIMSFYGNICRYNPNIKVLLSSNIWKTVI